MKYLKDVVTLEYDISRCIGCRMCTEVCPHNVFEMKNGKSFITNRDKCMECGACMMNCPAEAINVQKGVGCAYAIISSKLKGSDEISCGCGCNDKKNSSCC